MLLRESFRSCEMINFGIHPALWNKLGSAPETSHQSSWGDKTRVRQKGDNSHQLKKEKLNPIYILRAVQTQKSNIST